MGVYKKQSRESFLIGDPSLDRRVFVDGLLHSHAPGIPLVLGLVQCPLISNIIRSVMALIKMLWRQLNRDESWVFDSRYYVVFVELNSFSTCG